MRGNTTPLLGVLAAAAYAYPNANTHADTQSCSVCVTTYLVLVPCSTMISSTGLKSLATALSSSSSRCDDYTTVTSPYTGTGSITAVITSTISPSGTNKGTKIVITPVVRTSTLPGTSTSSSSTSSTRVSHTSTTSADNYVTITAPYTGTGSISAPTTSTIPPSGTNPGTKVVITPVSTTSSKLKTSTSRTSISSTVTRDTSTFVVSATSTTRDNYVTVTAPYTGTDSITAPITSTISPSGTNPGTKIIITPVTKTLSSSKISLSSTGPLESTTVASTTTASDTYITITAPYTGTGSITAPITSTIPPSGTNPGTKVVITPVKTAASSSSMSLSSTSPQSSSVSASSKVSSTPTNASSSSKSVSVSSVSALVSTTTSDTYITIITPYTGTGTITGPITSTIPPTGTNPGTKVIITPIKTPTSSSSAVLSNTSSSTSSSSTPTLSTFTSSSVVSTSSVPDISASSMSKASSTEASTSASSSSTSNSSRSASSISTSQSKSSALKTSYSSTPSSEPSSSSLSTFQSSTSTLSTATSSTTTSSIVQPSSSETSKLGQSSSSTSSTPVTSTTPDAKITTTTSTSSSSSVPVTSSSSPSAVSSSSPPPTSSTSYTSSTMPSGLVTTSTSTSSYSVSSSSSSVPASKISSTSTSSTSSTVSSSAAITTSSSTTTSSTTTSSTTASSTTTSALPTPSCSGLAWSYYQLDHGNDVGHMPWHTRHGEPIISRKWTYDMLNLTMALALQKPTKEGISKRVGWGGNCGNPVLPDGTGALQRGFFIMQHYGYFKPKTAGTYTFSVPYADDSAFVWLGDKAVKGWDQRNADVASWIAPSGPGRAPFSLTVTTPGELIPFRILMAEAMWCSSYSVVVTDPKNKPILGMTDAQYDDQFVSDCGGVDWGLPTSIDAPVVPSDFPASPVDAPLSVQQGFTWQYFGLDEGNGNGNVSAYSVEDASKFINSGAQEWASKRTNVRRALSHRKPLLDGVSQLVHQPVTAGEQLRLFGKTYPQYNPRFMAVQYTSYFVPNMAGAYVFSISAAYDAAYLWMGDKAKASDGWGNDNADLIAWRGAPEKKFTVEVQQQQVGTPVPMRLLLVHSWSGLAPTYSLSLTVKDPGDITILSNTKQTGKHFVTNSELAK
ncbi:hypothetical protein VHEMI10319 [[Torrubiella] hemipterigena]|uniref:PA14 domain-containing protein n=1 Tax=[Torrubiella] hemipterigena TaxID=1531966 RepID=A0A0A1TRZ1_9HYPO|nr:hypothetical protein VHEMI10319 [[Torrubiella] hemipterigena]